MKEVPAAVNEAAARSYGMTISGYLFEPRHHGLSFDGLIFFDKADRFDTGTRIRTSAVIEFVERSGYVIAVTNKSAYVLVDKDGPWKLALARSGGA